VPNLEPTPSPPPVPPPSTSQDAISAGDPAASSRTRPADGPVGEATVTGHRTDAGRNGNEADHDMIDKATEAQILRLSQVEKWPIGTIATQLGVHHGVVERVLKQGGVPLPRVIRTSKLDPFFPFITETLEKYPRLTASRLYQMCCERGYHGSPHHFRHVIHRIRPRPPVKAYLRLKTLPGEQAQVDWGHFGTIRVGSRTLPLIAFVMVFSFSRWIFARFFLGARMAQFLLGHQEAFATAGGVTRAILYDNLKSVVLERRRDAIRFHPTLLEFAAHYRFEPRVAAPYQAHEKGGVERAIRTLRDAFFAARQFRDLDDLNAQARLWCATWAMDRPWKPGSEQTVGQVFATEQEQLVPLPLDSFPAEEQLVVRVGKTPYARFDKNDYSVPHSCVRTTLTVLASETTVRVLKDHEVVSIHQRCYDQHQTIEDPRHIDALWQQKRHARKNRAIDRLTHAAPSSDALLVELARRGENIGSACGMLLRLLDEFGANRLDRAIQEALAHHAPHPRSVRLVLERLRRDEGRAPTLPIALPDDPRIQNLSVKPHSLDPYDDLTVRDDDPEADPANPPSNPEDDSHDPA
jgi:transposase